MLGQRGATVTRGAEQPAASTPAAPASGAERTAAAVHLTGLSPLRDRRPWLLLGALLLLGAVMVAGIALGAVRIPVSDVIASLAGDHEGAHRSIVWNLRLPRVLIAALVGMNLAIAGTLLQSVTRNPLADPHLLGLSAGGALLAVLLLKIDPAASAGRIPPIAFAGSLAGAAVVYVLAWRGGVSPTRLLLAGVAVGALFSALTTGILLTSTLTAQAMMAWLAGGFYARTWPHFEVIWPYWAAGSAVAMLLARQLDVLALGDEPASVLGIRVQRVRLLLTALAALLTGSAVAVAGLIGFVGLVIPHLARMLVGAGHRYLIPMAAVLGATLLVASDIIARMIAAPRELPVGIVTAVLGAPVFVYLLRRRV